MRQLLTYPIIDNLSRASKNLLLSESNRNSHPFSDYLYGSIDMLDNVEPSHKVVGMKQNAYMSFRERYLLRKFWERVSESTSYPIEDVEMRMLTRSFMEPAVYLTKVSEVFVEPVERKEAIINNILGMEPERLAAKVFQDSKLYNKIRASLNRLGVVL